MLVLFAVVPALAVIAAYGAADSRRQVQTVRDQSLVLARTLAAQQTQLAGHTRVLLDMLARHPAVQARDRGAVEELFRGMVRENPLFTAILLLDVSGQVVASWPTLAAPASFAGRKYFQDALRTRAFSAGEYLLGRISGLPVFNYAAPVPGPDGSPLGVVATGLPMNRYDALLADPSFPRDMRYVLHDHKGLRLHRFPAQDWFKLGVQAPDSIRRPMEESVEDFGQFDGFGPDGAPISFGFVRLRLAPDQPPYMTVSVGLPRPTWTGLLLSGPGLALGLLLLALLAAFLVARVLGERTISAGVARLVDAAGRLEAGDLSARAGPLPACGEIVALGQAFDRMTEGMQARERERLAAEEALRASEEKYRRMVETAMEGIWSMDADLRTTYVNQVMADMFGCEPGEMMGRRPDEFVPPEEMDAHLARMERRRQGRDEVYEQRFRRKDGGDLWAIVSARVLQDDQGRFAGSFAMLTDITIKKTRMDQLELLTRAVENSLNGYMVLDAEGRFIYANRAHLTMWGHGSLTEILGTPLGRLCRDPRQGGRILDELGTRGRCLLEFEALRRDGSCFDVSMDLFAFEDSAGHRFYPGSTWDVTQRNATRRELTAAKEAAEDASRAKSEFLATMSHEIRTPLNGVMGMLQLLRTTAQDLEQTEYVDTALQSTRNLLRILSDILDLSRIEAGSMRIVDEPFELSDVLTPVAGILAPEARIRGLSFSVETEGRIPRLGGDPGRLRQILFNLAGNALKYTRTGRVGLKASILPSCFAPDRVCLYVCVWDTGVGMDPKHLSEMFEAFTQAAGAATRSQGGAGLGLAIVKRLTRLMGGTLQAVSEPGQGTEMHLVLPLRPLPPVVRPPENAVTQAPERVPPAGAGLGVGSVPAPEGPSLSGMRVLVAEDERINRFSLARMLAKLGVAAEIVESGQKALDALARSRFDCVLMDIRMPGMDGMAVTQQIRSGAGGVLDPDVPVVALTAHAMAGDRERFLASGMNAYLSKPVDMEELSGTLAGIGRR